MEILDKGKNSIGKSIQVGRYSLTEQTIKPFKLWIDNFNDFQRFNKSQKRELYLRWKWGFTSNETNEALEQTRRGMVERIKISQDNPAEDIQWATSDIIRFEDYCYKTMGEIGLLDFKSQEQIKVKKMVDSIFNDLD